MPSILTAPIHPNFNGLIGQHHAKNLLSASLRAVSEGRSAIQPLATAPAGTGKSEVCHRYCDALESQDFRVIRMASPTEMRLAGGAWDDFISTITDYTRKYAIWIDEAHLMMEDNVKNMRTLRSFLFKALDRTNTNRDIEVTEGCTTRFDRSKNVVILSTNFADKLDPSGALQSRFDKLELSLYNEAETKEILVKMLSENDMEWDSEEVLTIISRCGRGTVRPIKNIVELALTVHGNSVPLTKNHVMQVLKMSNVFPKGLTRDEVKLLQMCAETDTTKDAQFLACTPSCSVAQLRQSKGYLTSSQVNFLEIQPRGMVTSRLGRAYLQYIQAQGFLNE